MAALLSLVQAGDALVSADLCLAGLLLSCLGLGDLSDLLFSEGLLSVDLVLADLFCSASLLCWVLSSACPRGLYSLEGLISSAIPSSNLL